MLPWPNHVYRTGVVLRAIAHLLYRLQGHTGVRLQTGTSGEGGVVSSWRKRLFSVAALLFVGLGANVAAPSDAMAEMRCQEISRTCMESGTRGIATPGGTVYMPAPVIPGYTQACWNWQKRFQCIETDPILQCESGRDFYAVRNACSLTSASILATMTINATTYITSAQYEYRCNFSDWQTGDTLPANQECVMLESVVQDTEVVHSAEPGTPTSSGSPPVTPTLAEQLVVEQQKTDTYVCYSEPTTVCSDVCYETIKDPATGQLEEREVACTSPVTNCTSTSRQCNSSVNDDGTGGTLAVGPDGRCVEQTEQFLCENASVPRCLDEDNCTLESTRRTSVQSNGVALSQEQTYVCTNETRSCAEVSEISECVSPNAWGWDQLHHRSTMAVGLGEFNQALAKLDGIKKGLNQNDLYIFSGQDLRCRYPIGNFLNTAIIGSLSMAAYIGSGGLALPALATTASFINDAINSKLFGVNCCKDHVIEGSDAWYKLGSCTADEVKLSVARQKGLYEYIGEYCSKKGGFPIRQCVQRTRTFCVFDDMLALVVNKQGRAQLDQIAAADPTSAILVPEQSFELFGPLTSKHKYSGVMNNGSWQFLVKQGGSQLWYWRYPGYCRSRDLQQEAYGVFQKELEDLVERTGGDRREQAYTAQEAAEILAAAQNLDSFQECGDAEGVVHFLTCSADNDNCDVNRKPAGPEGLVTDFTGGVIDDADLRWRVQGVRANQRPGQHGVLQTMATNASYAAVSTSVNNYITAVGSCQGLNCLYRFVFTDRDANGGFGAQKKVVDYANFPLYTLQPSASEPAIDYLSPTGVLAAGRHASDPNRGLGDPLDLNRQRFIFRPNFSATAPSQGMHSHFLLEWAASSHNDWKPVVVPTNLAPGTPGFWPHGNASDLDGHFFISGSCDPSSRWCNYQIETLLEIQRHPWGTPESPRCWGFSIEQIAALDFDKMDLSQWLNSLDLSGMSAGLSESAAQAMTDQTVATAQASFSAQKSGTDRPARAPAAPALTTNTDILPSLSGDNFGAYVLKLGLTSNWPQYDEDGVNDNPVTNVRVRWGDGSGWKTMQKHANGKIFYAEFDYGDLPPREYKIEVEFDTRHHGRQALSTSVRITPHRGQAPVRNTEPDFKNPGAGGYAGVETPAKAIDGTMADKMGADQRSPGTSHQYDQQGDDLTPPQ